MSYNFEKKLSELYEESVNLTNKKELKPILEIIKKEKNKSINEECVSLKIAIRIYLENSTDYNNEFFTKICEVQEKLDNYYDKIVSRYILENSNLFHKRR